MGIFVVLYKQPSDKPALVEGYLSLYVGPNRERFGAAGRVVDGAGDDIANSNSSFCEFTALYWVWENCDDLINGILHNRRFFDDSARRDRLMTLDFISVTLDIADLILPQIDKVEGRYVSRHGARDLELLWESIFAVKPGHLDAFNECMGLLCGCPFNMFVVNSQAYDAYCLCWFSFVFDLRERMTIPEWGSRGAYLSRVCGFLLKRLMNVYSGGSGVRVVEEPVLITEPNPKRSISMDLVSLHYSRSWDFVTLRELIQSDFARLYDLLRAIHENRKVLLRRRTPDSLGCLVQGRLLRKTILKAFVSGCSADYLPTGIQLQGPRFYEYPVWPRALKRPRGLSISLCGSRRSQLHFLTRGHSRKNWGRPCVLGTTPPSIRGRRLSGTFVSEMDASSLECCCYH